MNEYTEVNRINRSQGQIQKMIKEFDFGDNSNNIINSQIKYDTRKINEMSSSHREISLFLSSRKDIDTVMRFFKNMIVLSDFKTFKGIGLNQVRDIKKWIKFISVLGGGADGLVLDTKLKGIDRLNFIVKTTKDTGDNKSLIEEFIKYAVLNNLRKIIPNFVMSYGFFQCNSKKGNIFSTDAAITIPSDHDICECVGRDCIERNFMILEKIVYPKRGEVIINSVQKLLGSDLITFEEIVNIVAIVAISMHFAQREYKFLHNDLNTRNVALQKLGDVYHGINYNVEGKEYKFKFKELPVILDFGASTIVDTSSLDDNLSKTYNSVFLSKVEELNRIERELTRIGGSDGINARLTDGNAYYVHDIIFGSSKVFIFEIHPQPRTLLDVFNLVKRSLESDTIYDSSKDMKNFIDQLSQDYKGTNTNIRRFIDGLIGYVGTIRSEIKRSCLNILDFMERYGFLHRESRIVDAVTETYKYGDYSYESLGQQGGHFNKKRYQLVHDIKQRGGDYINDRIKHTLNNFDPTTVPEYRDLRLGAFEFNVDDLKTETGYNSYAQKDNKKCNVDNGDVIGEEVDIKYVNPGDFRHLSDTTYYNYHPEDLPKDMDKKTTYNWTVVRNRYTNLFDIRFGRIINFMELGSKHTSLMYNDPVYIAGELAIEFNTVSAKWKYTININSSKINAFASKVLSKNKVEPIIGTQFYRSFMLKLALDVFKSIIRDGEVVKDPKIVDDIETPGHDGGLHEYYSQDPKLCPKIPRLKEVNKFLKDNEMNECIGTDNNALNTGVTFSGPDGKRICNHNDELQMAIR